MRQKRLIYTLYCRIFHLLSYMTMIACIHRSTILTSLHSTITLLLTKLQAYSNSMSEYGYTIPTLWEGYY